jgi:hypothetical protein
MSLVGFEPTTPVGERPQTYALDRAGSGTGEGMVYITENCKRQNVRQISREAHAVCIFCFVTCNLTPCV